MKIRHLHEHDRQYRVFLFVFYACAIIMNSIKNVIDVISFEDSDTTCIEGIRKAINKYPNRKLKFANGGDRHQKSTPETKFCEKNQVETLWEIGGNNKKNSSSWILSRWKEKN